MARSVNISNLLQSLGQLQQANSLASQRQMQADAMAKQERQNKLSTLGTLAGAAIGSTGGPAGIGLGASIGGAAGGLLGGNTNPQPIVNAGINFAQHQAGQQARADQKELMQKKQAEQQRVNQMMIDNTRQKIESNPNNYLIKKNYTPKNNYTTEEMEPTGPVNDFSALLKEESDYPEIERPMSEDVDSFYETSQNERVPLGRQTRREGKAWEEVETIKKLKPEVSGILENLSALEKANPSMTAQYLKQMENRYIDHTPRLSKTVMDKNHTLWVNQKTGQEYVIKNPTASGQSNPKLYNLKYNGKTVAPMVTTGQVQSLMSQLRDDGYSPEGLSLEPMGTASSKTDNTRYTALDEEGNFMRGYADAETGQLLRSDNGNIMTELPPGMKADQFFSIANMTQDQADKFAQKNATFGVQKTGTGKGNFQKKVNLINTETGDSYRVSEEQAELEMLKNNNLMDADEALDQKKSQDAYRSRLKYLAEAIPVTGIEPPDASNMTPRIPPGMNTKAVMDMAEDDYKTRMSNKIMRNAVKPDDKLSNSEKMSRYETAADQLDQLGEKTKAEAMRSRVKKIRDVAISDASNDTVRKLKELYPDMNIADAGIEEITEAHDALRKENLTNSLEELKAKGKLNNDLAAERKKQIEDVAVSLHYNKPLSSVDIKRSGLPPGSTYGDWYMIGDRLKPTRTLTASETKELLRQGKALRMANQLSETMNELGEDAGSYLGKTSGFKTSTLLKLNQSRDPMNRDQILHTTVRDLGLSITNAMTGATIEEHLKEDIKAIIPSVYDSPELFRTKLEMTKLNLVFMQTEIAGDAPEYIGQGEVLKALESASKYIKENPGKVSQSLVTFYRNQFNKIQQNLMNQNQNNQTKQNLQNKIEQRVNSAR